MNLPDDEIACVGTGNLVEVEMWQQHLKEAGIESRVVGEDLTTSYGPYLTGSIELWVRRDDLAKAQEVLAEVTEAKRGDEQP